MRALVPLLLLVAAAPVALAGAGGCYAVPPGYLMGSGSCSVSFTTGPGTILVTVEANAGSIGDVVIHGDGPGVGTVVANCALRINAGTCTGPFYLFAPVPGSWTFTAHATNANFAGPDSRVWFAVSWP